jgi:hypothetical protein
MLEGMAEGAFRFNIDGRSFGSIYFVGHISSDGFNFGKDDAFNGEFAKGLVIDFGAPDDPDFSRRRECACLTAHRFPGEAGGVGAGENPVLSSRERMLREGIPGFASHQDNIFLIFSSADGIAEGEALEEG